MAKCGSCGATIIIGGVRDGENRFCNATCHRNAAVLELTRAIPPELAERRAREMWEGPCPKCRHAGPVDLHKYHQVWSALVLTNWNSASQLSCRGCGCKRQAGALVFSFFLGWWGFPWGLVLTPVQITRNIVSMVRGPSPRQPSAELVQMAKLELGLRLQAVAADQQARAQT